MFAIVLISVLAFLALAADAVRSFRRIRYAEQLIRGLRSDIETVGRSVADAHARHETVHQHLGAAANAIRAAHTTAAVAHDRLQFYTRESAILNRLGVKYDKVIARITAERAGAVAAQSDATPSPAADTTTADDIAPIAESIGSPAIPCS